MTTDPNVHVCSNSNVNRKLHILHILEYVISSLNLKFSVTHTIASQG